MFSQRTENQLDLWDTTELILTRGFGGTPAIPEDLMTLAMSSKKEDKLVAAAPGCGYSREKLVQALLSLEGVKE